MFQKLSCFSYSILKYDFSLKSYNFLHLCLSNTLDVFEIQLFTNLLTKRHLYFEQYSRCLQAHSLEPYRHNPRQETKISRCSLDHEMSLSPWKSKCCTIQNFETKRGNTSNLWCGTLTRQYIHVKFVLDSVDMVRTVVECKLMTIQPL